MHQHVKPSASTPVFLHHLLYSLLLTARPSRKFSPMFVNFSPTLVLFSHRWGLPPLFLAAYLRFWSVIYYLLTAWLVIFKKEVWNIAVSHQRQLIISRTKNQIQKQI